MQAKKTKVLYNMLGYPSIKDFKNIIRSNMIMNCLITKDDIYATEEIFEPKIHALKKTTRKS